MADSNGTHESQTSGRDGAAYGSEDEQAIARELGITGDLSSKTDLLRLAMTMYQSEFEHFGFVVYRTCLYRTDADRARWARFWHSWETWSRQRLVAMGAEDADFADGTSFANKLAWKLVEDAELDNADPAEIGEAFQKLIDTGDEDAVPSGCDLQLALMVDEESVRSWEEGTKPFVIGVSSDEPVLNEETGNDEAEVVDFKITRDVLIPDVWESLQVEDVSALHPKPGEFYEGASR